MLKKFVEESFYMLKRRYMKMTYTEKEKQLVVSLVQEFSKVENKEQRSKLVPWYSLATGIKDDEKTKKIMEDIGAI